MPSGAEQVGGFFGAIETAQDNHFEVARLEVIGVDAEGAIEVVESGGPITAGTVDLGESVEGGGLPGVVPGGFVESGVSVRVAVKEAEGNAEEVERFAVFGVGVVGGEGVDGVLKVSGGVGEFAAAEVPAAEGFVAAGVGRIAADSFTPISFRVAGSVAVLFEMQADEVELLVAGDIFGEGGFARGGGDVGGFFGGGLVGNQRAIVGGDGDGDILRGGAVG